MIVRTLEEVGGRAILKFYETKEKLILRPLIIIGYDMIKKSRRDLQNVGQIRPIKDIQTDDIAISVTNKSINSHYY